VGGLEGTDAVLFEGGLREELPEVGEEVGEGGQGDGEVVVEEEEEDSDEFERFHGNNRLPMNYN
jgi:hypothetical protein